eukprot:m51a1_g13916 hypothetical protein (468) ;mRNA; r:796589-798451
MASNAKFERLGEEDSPKLESATSKTVQQVEAQKEAQDLALLSSHDGDEAPVISLDGDLKVVSRRRFSTDRIRKSYESLKSNGDLSGLALNALSSFLFSGVVLFIKLAANSGLAAFEIVFIRSVIQLALCLAWLAVVRVNPLGPRQSWVLLWTRGMVGIGSMGLWMLAIKMLPLADSVVINFLSPVFTAIFGFFILKEKITKVEIAGYVLCFVGIVFVARPPFIFGKAGSAAPSVIVIASSLSSSFSAIGTTDKSVEWQMRLIGVSIGVVSAICAGLAYVVTRKIGKGVHPWVVVSYLSISGIIVAPPATYFVEGFTWPTRAAWGYCVALSVLAFFAQGLMTVALQQGKAGRVTVASYLQIIFAFIWGMGILGETLSWTSGIGSLLITVNAVIAGWQAWYGDRSAAHKPIGAHPAAGTFSAAVMPRPSVDYTRVPHADDGTSPMVELENVSGSTAKKSPDSTPPPAAK